MRSTVWLFTETSNFENTGNISDEHSSSLNQHQHQLMAFDITMHRARLQRLCRYEIMQFAMQFASKPLNLMVFVTIKSENDPTTAQKNLKL